MKPRTPTKTYGANHKTSPRPASTLTLVTINHRSARELFSQFASDNASKRQEKEELLKLAAVEQEVFRWLVAKLQDGATDTEYCDVKVVVLKEYIRHHVKQEVSTLVPETPGRGLHIRELSKILQNVQQNLQAELTQA